MPAANNIYEFYANLKPFSPLPEKIRNEFLFPKMNLEAQESKLLSSRTPNYQNKLLASFDHAAQESTAQSAARNLYDSLNKLNHSRLRF